MTNRAKHSSSGDTRTPRGDVHLIGRALVFVGVVLALLGAAVPTASGQTEIETPRALLFCGDGTPAPDAVILGPTGFDFDSTATTTITISDTELPFASTTLSSEASVDLILGNEGSAEASRSIRSGAVDFVLGLAPQVPVTVWHLDRADPLSGPTNGDRTPILNALQGLPAAETGPSLTGLRAALQAPSERPVRIVIVASVAIDEALSSSLDALPDRAVAWVVGFPAAGAPATAARKHIHAAGSHVHGSGGSIHTLGPDRSALRAFDDILNVVATGTVLAIESDDPLSASSIDLIDPTTRTAVPVASNRERTGPCRASVGEPPEVLSSVAAPVEIPLTEPVPPPAIAVTGDGAPGWALWLVLGNAAVLGAMLTAASLPRLWVAVAAHRKSTNSLRGEAQ